MSKPVLISGIQPTGRLHIGNYLGALKQFVGFQNSGEYECLFFIADLHALTTNPDPKDLKRNTTDLAISFIAAGLDGEKSTLFIQSKIPAHYELYQFLTPLMPVSELIRMTAFKEKVIQTLKLKEGEILSKEDFEKAIEGSNFALAAYPILMTADIVIYDSKFVPVGEDQLQHLELARTLVRKFNKKFGKTFIEPQSILAKTARVMSLDDPNKKMSKSKPAGCIFLDDAPEDIGYKIKRAVTDSGSEIKFDEKNKPAISNLLEIHSAFSGEDIKALEKKFKDKSYVEFKEDLARVVIAGLASFQKKKAILKDKTEEIEKIFLGGTERASAVANKKLIAIKQKIGLLQ